MDDTLTRAVWIDRFVMHTRALGARADPKLIKDIAAELWPTLGHMQPEAAAQEEYDGGCHRTSDEGDPIHGEP